LHQMVAVQAPPRKGTTRTRSSCAAQGMSSFV